MSMNNSLVNQCAHALLLNPEIPSSIESDALYELISKYRLEFLSKIWDLVKRYESLIPERCPYFCVEWVARCAVLNVDALQVTHVINDLPYYANIRYGQLFGDIDLLPESEQESARIERTEDCIALIDECYRVMQRLAASST